MATKRKYPPEVIEWAKQHAIDPGAQPGPMARHEARIAHMEQENRELRRVNELLKESSSRGA